MLIALMLNEVISGIWAWAFMAIGTGYLWIQHPQARARSTFRGAVVALACIPAVAAIGALRHDRRDMLRDIWLATTPVIPLAFGYLATRIFGARRSLRAFLLTAALVIVGFLVSAATVPDYLTRDTAYDSEVVASRSLLMVIPLVIQGTTLLRRMLCGTSLFYKALLWIMAALGSFATIIGTSRTLLFVLVGYLVTIVLAAAARTGRWSRAVVILLVVASTLVASIVPLAGIGAFLPESISAAIEETAISDYSDISDIHANWRGYETYLGLQQFWTSSAVYKLIGGGLGQRVELDFPMELGGIEYTSIPVFHNGFNYLLTKAGLLGILLFLAGITLLWRTMKFESSPSLWNGAYRWWWLVTVASTTLVVAGPYNPSLMSLMLIAGVVAAVAEQVADPAANLAQADPSVVGSSTSSSGAHDAQATYS